MPRITLVRHLWLVVTAGLALGLAQAQMGTYTNASFGYRIDYPLGWEVVSYDDEGDGAVEFYQDDAFLFLDVFAADELPVADLDELAALLLEDLDDMLDDMLLRSQARTVLAGLPAATVEYEAYDDWLETHVTGLVIVALGKGIIVVIDVEAPSADMERLRPVFEAMLASFAFLP